MPTKTQPSIHPAPHELAGLNGVLQSLFGLPFLFARRSYGDELKLHFGSERTYDHPKLEGLSRGSHVLGLRASRWRLMGGEFSGTPPTSIEALAAGTPVQMAFASAGSDGYNLAMILAAVLGGIDPFGGFGRVLGLFLSLVLLQVISTGFNLLGFSPYLTAAIWGATMILAIVIAMVRDRWIARLRPVKPKL